MALTPEHRRSHHFGPLGVVFLFVRLIPMPNSHFLPWSELGPIRRTMVFLGGGIIVLALFGRLAVVVALCAAGVWGARFVLRVLYRRKWR